MSAHDRYLAAYRQGTTTVWCANRHCGTFGEAQEIRYEEEYGQGWLSPEECPECHADWLQDPPSEEDDE